MYFSTLGSFKHSKNSWEMWVLVQIPDVFFFLLCLAGEPFKAAKNGEPRIEMQIGTGKIRGDLDLTLDVGWRNVSFSTWQK